MFCFFFQAEDGIRDHCVTGVQTCALPISGSRRDRYLASATTAMTSQVARAALGSVERTCLPSALRSEERRVGKECRARWWHERVIESRGGVMIDDRVNCIRLQLDRPRASR